MKLFLIITSSLLVSSLVIAVIAYWWVVSQMPPTESISGNDQTVLDSSHIEDVDSGKSTSPAVPSEGIPLRNLPLGDTQKSALETVGVDVETFVITPSMQVCAEEKLGGERMDEIIAGDAPGAIEIIRLTPCLSAE